MSEPIAFRKVTGAARLIVIETDMYPRRLSGLNDAIKELKLHEVDESWWITAEVTELGWLRLRAEFEEQL